MGVEVGELGVEVGELREVGVVGEVGDGSLV